MAYFKQNISKRKCEENNTILMKENKEQWEVSDKNVKGQDSDNNLKTQPNCNTWKDES